jgi:hypothetical protein
LNSTSASNFNKTNFSNLHVSGPSTSSLNVAGNLDGGGGVAINVSNAFYIPFNAIDSIFKYIYKSTGPRSAGIMSAGSVSAGSVSAGPPCQCRMGQRQPAIIAIWMSVLCSPLNSFTSQARRRETAQETCAT